MLKRAPINEFTVEEYLAFEEASVTKHEYLGGKIYDMAGGAPEHARIQANLTLELGQRLKTSPCSVFSSDLRVAIQEIDLFSYPDLTIICGALEFDSRSKTTVTNPSVIVEVLSRATRAYDRGDKFKFYKKIPSLQEYVLVESKHAHVEVLRSEGKRWTIEMHDGLDAVMVLQTFECNIPLSDIYFKVSWVKE